MAGLSNVLNKALGAKYAKMMKIFKEDGRAVDKSALQMFFLYLKISKKYGAALSDFHLYKLYNKTDNEIKKYILLADNVAFVRKMNNIEFRPIFEEKTLFAKKFKKFFRREFFILQDGNEESFEAFIKDKEYVFAKKDYTFSGSGIKKCAAPKFETLKNEGYSLVEEAIIQHEKMASLNMSSVNTVRIGSVLCGFEADIVYASLRVGVGGEVDNMGAGGLTAIVDAGSGVVITTAVNNKGENFTKHPISGVNFEGFQIPFWEEAKSLVREAAKLVPEVRYIGWDVAFSENGPEIIEGNYHPGYNVFQAADGGGKKYIFEKYAK